MQKLNIGALFINTSVSAFMIAVNELSDLKCKEGVLEPLVILLSPFTHIAEEIWYSLGHREYSSILSEYAEACTIEESFGSRLVQW